MVNWENYEEYMLLYADDELNATEQEALLAFVAGNPELQKELDAYKATQLVPDAHIIFAGKDSLLKHEEPKRTIALGKWTVYAAAAAVLLFAVVIIKQKNKTEETAIAAKTELISQPTPAVPADTVQQQEELHSTPANPVTIENKLAGKQPEIKKPVPQHSSTKQVQQVQQQAKEEIYITKEAPKQTETPKTNIPEPEKPVIANNQPVAEDKTTIIESPVPEEKKKKSLLAWLPIRKEKKEGVEVLASAVNDKIEQVKTIKNKLNDSELAFKIGKTELFVVKL